MSLPKPGGIFSFLDPENILASKLTGNAIVNRVSYDLKYVSTGVVFCAWKKKQQSDVAQLVREALVLGAAAIVLEDPAVFATLSGPLLLCRNVRKVYAQLSHGLFGFPSQALELVGVTGTNGKTTTTSLLHQGWLHQGKAAGLLGTIAYQIGSKKVAAELTTPDAWDLNAYLSEMVEEGLTHAVMEVSSIGLDQYRTAGLQFAATVFTNLTQDHLDYHLSMDNYAAAKKKLFLDHTTRCAVFNADDAWFPFFCDGITSQRVAYSLLSQKSLRHKEVIQRFSPLPLFSVQSWHQSPEGICATIETPDQACPTLELKLSLWGQHNLSNALAVLAVEWSLGRSIVKAVEALAHARAPEGRLELVTSPHWKIEERPRVFVDYAHTPDALVRSLSTLTDLKPTVASRVYVVVGCGGDRDVLKRPDMGFAASEKSDGAIFTSDNPRSEDPQTILEDMLRGVALTRRSYVEREVNRRVAIEKALSKAARNDVVLIAGKGHEKMQVMGDEKQPFDDVVCAREILARWQKGAPRRGGPVQSAASDRGGESATEVVDV